MSRRAQNGVRGRKPAFWDMADETDDPARPCDHAGCEAAGAFRAPKAPDRIREYYWFCLEHVREYNRAWNYCAGRSDAEIEAMIRDDVVGWRPTWPLGRLGGQFSRARFDRLRDAFGLFGDGPEDRTGTGSRPANGTGAKERAAMEAMDLTPPVTIAVLKTRYKELVKRHHPDANGGDKAAEERLKLINQAYATLKERLGV